LFTRTGNVWTQQGNKIAGPTGAGHLYFGRVGALSGDSNTAAIGNSDRVWICVRSGGVWTQKGPVINNYGIDAYFTAPLGLSLK
jgi:hypothetical protein